MGILNFFKFTPPGDKKYGLFLSNYLKQEKHILECFGEIGASGSLNELKPNYDLFAKHFRAIQIEILVSCIFLNIKGDKAEKFYAITSQEVRKFDKDIWDLVRFKYDDPFGYGCIKGMVEALNEKPFKGKLNENIKVNLIKGFEIIELQFNEVIKSFI